MYVVWVPCYVPVVYPTHYHPFFYQPYPRVFPEVNEDVFVQSASKMEALMDDAGNLVRKISHSNEYANEVMGAAQESDQSKVDTLIRSSGVKSPFRAEYNPDRLKILLYASNQQVECCQLTIILRWKVQ